MALSQVLNSLKWTLSIHSGGTCLEGKVNEYDAPRSQKYGN